MASKHQPQSSQPQQLNVADALTAAKKELATVNQSIKDQETYYTTQQALIDDTINEWNDQLREFAEASKEDEAKRAQLTASILELEEEKRLLSEEVDTLEEKSTQLDTAYNRKAAGYRDELTTLNLEVDAKKQLLLETDLKVKARIEVVEGREAGVALKEQDLRERELALLSKESTINQDALLTKFDL